MQRDRAVLFVSYSERCRLADIHEIVLQIEPVGPGFDDLILPPSGVEPAVPNEFQFWVFCLADDTVHLFARAVGEPKYVASQVETPYFAAGR
jgi:hypothetical protein